MSNYLTVRLGDIGRVVTGRTPPARSPEAFRGNVPFITPTDIDGLSRFSIIGRAVTSDWDKQQSRVSLPPLTVCVVCIGATIGKICMTSIQSQSNQQINSITVDQQKFDPYFVFYKLGTLKDRLKQYATGAATPILNKSAFSELEIDVPSLQEQRRIASILSAYDDLIEANRRRVAILEEMARRLFEEWFVHLRFPGHATTPLHDTPDGPVPEGWMMGVVGDLLTLHRGYDLATTARRPGSTPVMTGSGRSGTHDTAKVAGPGVVTGRSGTVGQVFLVHEDFWPLNTALYVSAYHGATPSYGLFLLRTLKLQTHAGGAAVPTLNRNHVHALPTLRPPSDLIQQFDRFVMPMLESARAFEKQNDTLAAARDLLLPRLLSGQLSVTQDQAPALMAAE